MGALGSLVTDLEWIDVDHESAPGRVRRAATALAQRLGFHEHRSGEIAVATTELATNLLHHAVAGSVLLRVRRHAGEAGVEAIFFDRGPGIENIELIARDGYSSRGTLGVGIGAAMRLATWFDCYSIPGKGTVTATAFWKTGATVRRDSVEGLTRSMRGEARCGDAWAYSKDGSCTRIMLADGLGHGELAAVASSEAVSSFEHADGASASDTMRGIDRALRGTRGAAAAVVIVNEETSVVTFCGVGNISVWLLGPDGRKGLMSSPGIVGAYVKAPRELAVSFLPQTTIVMHSDGLTSKWDIAAYPGLRGRAPLLVAATLLRDAGVHHDDASVVVMRTA